MWTLKSFKVDPDETPNMAKVSITFINDDGVEKNVFERISDPSALKIVIDNGLNKLNNDEAMARFLANPPKTLEELMPVVTISEADQNRIDYDKNYQVLAGLKKDLDLGLIEQETYDDQLEITLSLKSKLA